MSTTENRIAGVVLQARTSLGLSVRDLAKIVLKPDGTPIAPSYVTDIEKSRSIPSDEISLSLAKALNLSPKKFMAARTKDKNDQS